MKSIIAFVGSVGLFAVGIGLVWTRTVPAVPNSAVQDDRVPDSTRRPAEVSAKSATPSPRTDTAERARPAEEIERIFANISAALANKEADSVDAAMMARWKAMISDPAVMRMIETEKRGQIERRYARMFNDLNLTAAQRDKVTQLLLDKRQAMTDVAAAAVVQGKDPLNDPDEFYRTVQATKAELDAKLKAELGDAGFKAYRENQQSRKTALKAESQIKLVENFEKSLSYRSMSLTADQGDQLLQSLERHGTNRINDKVVEDLKKTLTPKQMEVLAQIRAQQAAADERRKARREVLPDPMR